MIVIDVVNIVQMYVHIGNCHREYGTNSCIDNSS